MVWRGDAQATLIPNCEPQRLVDGATMLKTDATLDYTLFTVNNFASLSLFGRDVAVSEGSATDLFTTVARNLTVTSKGTISDSNREKVTDARSTGAAAFKHNWGFESVPLAYAKRSVGKPREINPLDPQYSRKVQMWRKLPLPIANFIGPMIARGLG